VNTGFPGRQGAKLEAQWKEDVNAYKEKYPEEGAEFEQLISGELPPNWDETLPRFTSEDKARPCFFFRRPTDWLMGAAASHGVQAAKSIKDLKGWENRKSGRCLIQLLVFSYCGDPSLMRLGAHESLRTG